MLDAVDGGMQGDKYFNLEVFAKALTQDVQLYDILNEGRATTNLDDVLLTETGREINKEDYINQSRELSFEEIDSNKSKRHLLTKTYTAPAIGKYRMYSFYSLCFCFILTSTIILMDTKKITQLEHIGLSH